MARMDSRAKIKEYFKKNLKKGYTEDSLKWALVSQGYSKLMVENALREVHKELAKKAPKLKAKPHITYELIDENFRPVKIKKPWWKRIFD